MCLMFCLTNNFQWRSAEGPWSAFFMIKQDGEACCISLGLWQEFLVRTETEDAEEVIQAELAEELQRSGF